MGKYCSNCLADRIGGRSGKKSLAVYTTMIFPQEWWWIAGLSRAGAIAEAQMQYTPENERLEPKDDGLEEEFPTNYGDFGVHVSFWECYGKGFCCCDIGLQSKMVKMEISGNIWTPKNGKECKESLWEFRGWWFTPLKGYKSPPNKNGRKCFLQLSTIKISGAMSLVFMGAYLHSGDWNH